MKYRPSKRAVVALVAVEIVSATLAWRDLSHRPAERVRGTKRLWRVLMVMNPGNSLVYWVVGRR
jgi:hypothetical protein